MDKYKMLHTKYYAALFSINSYFETEPDIQSIIQPDVQDAAQTTLEMLLSILNLDFIRNDIEFVRIYKEILYASEGMLKYWYRTGNYDVTVFEQEYLEMINHWEMVYGKETERARAGCHKVQWTLALARPRRALALREIEPMLQSSMRSRSASHFSIIEKKDIQSDILLFIQEREPGATRSSGPWFWHDRGAL